MKRFTLLLAGLLLFSATAAFAQLDVSAGYLKNSETMTLESTHLGTDGTQGFYAGLGGTIHLSPFVSLMPGVYYAYEHSNSAATIAFFTLDGNRQDHSLYVPLRLAAGFPVTPQFRLFLFGGPKAFIGISSISQVNASVMGLSYGEKVDNYEDYPERRFDLMLGGGIGMDIMEKFRVKVGYDWGLFDRVASDQEDWGLRVKQFHIGISLLL